MRNGDPESSCGGLLIRMAISSSWGGLVCVFSYHVWRKRELSIIEALAKKLAIDGFITVDMSNVVSASQKKGAWEDRLKPHLIEHWQTAEPTLNLDVEKETWGTPANGRLHHLSSTNSSLPLLPRVFSGNYVPQAVLAFIVDPDVSLVHFGRQTALKLRFLISPLWGMCSVLDAFITAWDACTCTPRGMFQLVGDDQAWHIVNLPNVPHGSAGRPLPKAAHMDDGIGSCYKWQGLPPGFPRDKDGDSSCLGRRELATTHDQDGVMHLHPSRLTLSAASPPPSLESLRTPDMCMDLDMEQRLLGMALHQLAILFYCETPGELNARRGATGFWPRSHLVMLEGLRSYLAASQATTAVPSSSPSLPSSSSSSSPPRAFLSWAVHKEAVVETFQGEPDNETQDKNNVFAAAAAAADAFMVQPVLREDQALLALGPMVHSGMWCVELMPGNNPRSILNCKIGGVAALRRGREAERRASAGSLSSESGGEFTGAENPAKWLRADYSAQRALTNRISRNSLLYQMYVSPVDNIFSAVSRQQEGKEEDGDKDANANANRRLSVAQIRHMAETYARNCLRREKEEGAQIADNIM